MPASGELAALFAKRGIGDDETDANNIEKEAANEAKDIKKEEITTISSTTAAGLPPRSSTSDISRPTMQPPTAAAAEEVDTPSQPINEEGPVKITNLIHNAEVKAVFDERNLEAGIPTPSFLADMRKNLKKPGEKRSSISTPTPQSKVGGGGYSSDSDAMKKKDTSDDNLDKNGKCKGSNTNYNSDSEIKAALSSSSNLLSKSIKKQPTASTSASTCSSDNEVPMDEEKVTTATAKHGTLAARRSRMVASRTAMSSSASSTTSDPNSKPPPKKSPSQARKERLLARIRASNASTSGNKSVESNEVFDASKTSIISPKSDEFEVCFAEDNIPSQHNPYLTSDTKNESIDSIGNELNESYGSAATLPTNNIQSKVKISMTKSNRSCTPEKSRLQNAATPKIRGNSNFARYEDKEEKVNEGTTTTGLITSQSSQPQISPIKQNPSPTKLPSFQEQQQQQQLETDYVASTPRRAINELYPMRQSPSQLSQMSGLTTPSCFPQELTAPLGGPSHLQQPMLIGGPIHEAASFKSDPLDNVVGVEGGSSAFSPGVEAENRRLREQVGTMAQKLEEKDAIISQLMKRIADLEMNNSAARGAAQAQQVNTTFVMDQGRSPSNVSSHVSSSLWGQSQLQDSTTRSQTSGSAFHQPVRKKSDVRSSVDSTSACLSMPSQSQSSKSTSLQKKSKQRGRSSGGSTPATSSTASVTTTNSSKSGKRTTARSRLKSSRTGSSQKSKKKDDDERKFVC